MSAALLHAVCAYALQATVVVLAGGLVAGAARWRDDPRARLILWRMVLAACVLLPLAAAIRPARDDSAIAPAVRLEGIAVYFSGATGAAGAQSVDPAAVVLVLLAAGALAFLARLAHAAALLRQVARRPDVPLALFGELQDVVGARARLVSAGAGQPFTFGRRTPVVVVPDGFAGEPAPVQRAVLAHELVHVRRGDWLHAALEEICRALLWFHPAIWWTIRELRLAREEVVDREASHVAGSRRAYMTTLLEFATRRDGHALRIVAFFRHRQLARRIAALSKEVSMSKPWLVASGMTAAILLTAAAQFAQAAFPLADLAWQTAAPPTPDASGPSALEQQAYQVSKDQPPPRKVHDVRMPYPDDVKAVITSAMVMVRLVIDADGSVAEARILSRKVGGPQTTPEALAAATRTLEAGTLTAVRQWKFEPPAKAPLAMTVAVAYDAEGGRKAPPPPPPAPKPGDGSVTRPVAIEQPAPAYPPDALRAGVQGVVRLSVTVGSDGRLKDARVIQSVPALDQAALDAVRQWTFRPGTKDGQAVDVVTEITMAFSLK
jgi:protein TonB